MSILDILNTGFALMGWLFIMFKTGQWFISVALKQWDKRRKLSRRQKAVNEFYDAFDLSKLLDYATERGYGLNEIAREEFDAEDQMQLAQLIGYSLSGYGTLSYVTDESYDRAAAAAPQQEKIK